MLSFEEVQPWISIQSGGGVENIKLTGVDECLCFQGWACSRRRQRIQWQRWPWASRASRLPGTILLEGSLIHILIHTISYSSSLSPSLPPPFLPASSFFSSLPVYNVHLTCHSNVDSIGRSNTEICKNDTVDIFYSLLKCLSLETVQRRVLLSLYWLKSRTGSHHALSTIYDWSAEEQTTRLQYLHSIFLSFIEGWLSPLEFPIVASLVHL